MFDKIIFYKPKETIEVFLINRAYDLEDYYSLIFGDVFSLDF